MTATEPVGIAVVGLGKIARDQHVPEIAASPAFTLAATVDPVARLEQRPHDLDALGGGAAGTAVGVPVGVLAPRAAHPGVGVADDEPGPAG